jgi:phage terminase large subunit-like protein
VFDDSPIPDPLGHGERAVGFFRALKHPLSTAQDRGFGLPRFWERIVRRIYGPRHLDGRRIVRTVFIMIPRGARKTATIGGGLGLLHSMGHEKVALGQVMLGAGGEEQAEYAFDEAVGMVRSTPALRKKVKIRSDYLEHQDAGSTLRLLSAEGDISHGSTPSAVFLDELHTFKNRKLWRALKTGLIKSPGTLLCITTTAGRSQTGLAWDEYQYARRVASGEIPNDAYLPIIFEPPPNADWRDEDLWHYVNPGLTEGFPVLEEMRGAVREAMHKPGEEDDFKQYNLNFWLDNALSPFVDMAAYDQASDQISLADLKGRPCWLSVDLSSTTDLTVILAVWRDDDDGYTVRPWFFCPKANLQERQDRTGAPYLDWANKGLITTTEGNVVDFRAVERTIRDLCDRFDVQEIAFDPYLARQVQPQLLEDGLPVVDFRQVPSLMMPALTELERAIVSGRFRHGGHPVLRFCFANAEAERNKHGHLTSLHKSKRWLSIDGAVAAAMAVSRASAGQNGRSIFESETFDPQNYVVTM